MQQGLKIQGDSSGTRKDHFHNWSYQCKDLKFKETPVVLALVTNQAGHPLSYELFAGSTSEAGTLISTVVVKKNEIGAPSANINIVSQ